MIGTDRSLVYHCGGCRSSVEPTVASLEEALRKQGHELDRGAIIAVVDTELRSTHASNWRKTILLVDDKELARNMVQRRRDVLVTIRWKPETKRNVSRFSGETSSRCSAQALRNGRPQGGTGTIVKGR